MVEQRTLNPSVECSSHSRPTKEFKKRLGASQAFFHSHRPCRFIGRRPSPGTRAPASLFLDADASNTNRPSAVPAACIVERTPLFLEMPWRPRNQALTRGTKSTPWFFSVPSAVSTRIPNTPKATMSRCASAARARTAEPTAAACFDCNWKTRCPTSARPEEPLISAAKTSSTGKWMAHPSLTYKLTHAQLAARPTHIIECGPASPLES